MKLNKLQEAMGDKMRPEMLAAKTGLSITTILKAKRGGNVTLGTATLIAKGLKVRTEDLV
jgi:hypothetical protein